MTPDELDAIEALYESASTPLPETTCMDAYYYRAMRSGDLLAAVAGIPALVAEVRRLQAVVERVTALAEDWRYKGEYGWDDGSHAYGPSPEGELLDNVSRDLLSVLDAAALGTTTPAGCTAKRRADRRPAAACHNCELRGFVAPDCPVCLGRGWERNRGAA